MTNNEQDSLDKWIVLWLMICGGIQFIGGLSICIMEDFAQGAGITALSIVWVWMARVIELLKRR